MIAVVKREDQIDAAKVFGAGSVVQVGEDGGCCGSDSRADA